MAKPSRVTVGVPLPKFEPFMVIVGSLIVRSAVTEAMTGVVAAGAAGGQNVHR
jgi:hypothetical protein